MKTLAAIILVALTGFASQAIAGAAVSDFRQAFGAYRTGMEAIDRFHAEVEALADALDFRAGRACSRLGSAPIVESLCLVEHTGVKASLSVGIFLPSVEAQRALSEDLGEEAIEAEIAKVEAALAATRSRIQELERKYPLPQ